MSSLNTPSSPGSRVADRLPRRHHLCCRARPGARHARRRRRRRRRCERSTLRSTTAEPLPRRARSDVPVDRTRSSPSSTIGCARRSDGPHVTRCRRQTRDRRASNPLRRAPPRTNDEHAPAMLDRSSADEATPPTEPNESSPSQLEPSMPTVTRSCAEASRSPADATPYFPRSSQASSPDARRHPRPRRDPVRHRRRQPPLGESSETCRPRTVAARAKPSTPHRPPQRAGATISTFTRGRPGQNRQPALIRSPPPVSAPVDNETSFLATATRPSAA